MKRRWIFLVILAVVALSMAISVEKKIKSLDKFTIEMDCKLNRAYEYVDLSIGCECGNKLEAEVPTESDELWPLVHFCARCKMRYMLVKESLPPKKGEWAKYYGYSGEVN